MFVVELDHTCFGIYDTREEAEFKQKHLLEVQLECTIREVVEPDEEPEPPYEFPNNPPVQGSTSVAVSVAPVVCRLRGCRHDAPNPNCRGCMCLRKANQ